MAKADWAARNPIRNKAWGKWLDHASVCPACRAPNKLPSTVECTIGRALWVDYHPTRGFIPMEDPIQGIG